MTPAEPDRPGRRAEKILGAALVAFALVLAFIVVVKILNADSDELVTNPDIVADDDAATGGTREGPGPSETSSSGTPVPTTDVAQLEGAVMHDLRGASLAQEAFFSANGYYTVTSDILTDFGWEPNGKVTIVIVTADTASYCMQGDHIDGGDTWTLSSHDGLTAGANC